MFWQFVTDYNCPHPAIFLRRLKAHFACWLSTTLSCRDDGSLSVLHNYSWFPGFLDLCLTFKPIQEKTNLWWVCTYYYSLWYIVYLWCSESNRVNYYFCKILILFVICSSDILVKILTILIINAWITILTYPFSEQQLSSLLGGQITDMMTTTAAKGGTFQNEQFSTQNGAS